MLQQPYKETESGHEGEVTPDGIIFEMFICNPLQNDFTTILYKYIKSNHIGRLKAQLHFV